MERLAERIAQNGWHIDYGILGSKYVLNMLGEYGRTEDVYKRQVLGEREHAAERRDAGRAERLPVPGPGLH